MRPSVAARLLRPPALLLMLLIAIAGACHAGGLYTGEAPVPSQSDSDRIEGLKNALAQVVIRVSGDPGALANPDLAKAVGDAERYVQQFQYRQDVATDANGQPQVRLTLVAQFDRDAIDRLLAGFGLIKGAATVPEQSGAPADATPGIYQLWIGGIHSAADYARVIEAVSGNEFVRDTQVQLVRGDGIEVRVAATGSLKRLLDSLDAGAILRVTNAKPPLEGIDALLNLAQ